MARANVRIRPAQRSDVDRLADLIADSDTASGVFSGRAMLDPGRDHIAARLADIVTEQHRTVLVADDDRSIVGLLVARTEDIGAIDVTPALHITHLLVGKDQRRRGVGRALLAAAVHLAEDRGLDRVLTTAASGSREANRYLARLGFAPLVVDRIASTAALRRTLGMADMSERIAALRRGRTSVALRTRTTPARPIRNPVRVLGRRA